MSNALKAGVVLLPFVVAFLLLRSCGEEEAQRWLERVRELDPRAQVAVDTEDLVVLAPSVEFGRSAADEILTFRDALVRDYGDLLGRPKAQRMVVVIFSGVDLLQQWAGQRWHRGSTENLYGYTDGMKAAMFLPPDPRFFTLRHETVHWVVSTARGGTGRLSPWLSEGLAQLFEAYDPSARPPHPPGISADRRGLVFHLVPGRIDVERLVGMEDYGAFTGSDALRNYAEALVLTAFLFLERDRDLLRQLVEAQWTGARGPTVFRNLYAPSEESFRRDLDRFLLVERGG